MIHIHRFILSLLFSIINWKLIDAFLIELPFWKYFIIEISILVMIKFLTFTYEKAGLDKTDGD